MSILSNRRQKTIQFQCLNIVQNNKTGPLFLEFNWYEDTFSLFKKIANTVFPRIIAGGDYSREVDYSREAVISNIAQWKLYEAIIILFSYPIKSKNYHIK